MSTCISYHVYLNIILHLASQWLGKTLGIHQFVYQNANLPYDFNVTNRKLFIILYYKCDVMVSYPVGESSFTPVWR